MNQKKYEKLLDKFIEEERAKSRIGSGDDMWYEQHIIDYVNKQRPFWIDFIKFIEKDLRISHNNPSKKDYCYNKECDYLFHGQCHWKYKKNCKKRIRSPS